MLYKSLYRLINLYLPDISKIINEYTDEGNLDKEKLGKKITKDLKNSLQKINFLLEKKHREELKKIECK